MGVDWDALVIGPVMGVFGEPVVYSRLVGLPLSITGVFDDGFTEVDPVSRPGLMSSKPTLGIRLEQFPPDFDAKEAQGDWFTVVRTGKTYVVNDGEPDSHGHALLHANLR